jgi:hypothetical protein
MLVTDRKENAIQEPPEKNRWIKDVAYFEYGTEENMRTRVMNRLSRFL